jgi:hypothetical protein
METDKLIFDDVYKFLAKEFEGGLFVNVYISGGDFLGELSVVKDYYTCLDGEVYLLEDGRKNKSNDDLMHLRTQCFRVGDYDPKQRYKRVIKYMSFKELEINLNLNGDRQ